MRPSALIKNWLSIEQMFQWLQDAPDKAAYKRRKAVWLTHTEKLHAGKVAEILGVSMQAVWLWVRQYNKFGPVGLERDGRGGRRWGFLSLEEETELLSPIIQAARSGKPLQTEAVKRIVEAKLERSVSISYIYKLLERHGWSEILAQSYQGTRPSKGAGAFERISKPWLRGG